MENPDPIHSSDGRGIGQAGRKRKSSKVSKAFGRRPAVLPCRRAPYYATPIAARRKFGGLKIMEETSWKYHPGNPSQLFWLVA